MAMTMSAWSSIALEPRMVAAPGFVERWCRNDDCDVEVTGDLCQARYQRRHVLGLVLPRSRREAAKGIEEHQSGLRLFDQAPQGAHVVLQSEPRTRHSDEQTVSRDAGVAEAPTEQERTVLTVDVEGGHLLAADADDLAAVAVATRASTHRRHRLPG
jgi:hypothetical protein